MPGQGGVWAGRFAISTFLLGGIAWLVIAVLWLGNVLAGLSPPIYLFGPASSRIVAAGGAGTWFVMGLLAYLIIGIVGIGLSTVFYQYIESTLGYPITGWKGTMAWIHLVLGAVGAAVASLLMTWGGFRAGAAFVSTNFGGGGLDPESVADITSVHATILGPLVTPVAIFMGIALLGYLAGGIGLGVSWLAARKK